MFQYPTCLSDLVTDVERVGVIKSNGEIVELKNVSGLPDAGAIISTEDLEHLDDPETVATWHTHPEGGVQPSQVDIDSFLNWPEHYHLIIDRDEVGVYFVLDDRVVRE